MKLEPNGVVADFSAGQPGPIDGVRAFLDARLRHPTVIMKRHDPLGRWAPNISVYRTATKA